MWIPSGDYGGWVLLLVLLLAGCDDRFLPASVLSSFRVLGVRAEPPEVLPGETAVIDALVFDPIPREVTFEWLACDPASAGALTPCDDDEVIHSRPMAASPRGEGLKDLGTSTIAHYAFPGAIATEETQRAVVLLVARAGADEIIARKEIALAARKPTNKNPTIELVLAKGQRLDVDQAPRARGGAALELSAIVTSSSAEPFLRRRPDGSIEPALEDIRIQWFTTAGRYGVDYRPPSAKPILDLFVDAGPPPSDAGPREGGGESSKDEFGTKVTLNLPDTRSAGDEQIRIFIVVRDSRGGTTWTERRLTLRP